MEKNHVDDLINKGIENILEDENLIDEEASIINDNIDIKDTTIEELKHDIELLWKDNQEKDKIIRDQGLRIIKLTDKLTESMDKGYELHQNTQVLFKQILEQQPQSIKQLENKKGFFSKIFKK